MIRIEQESQGQALYEVLDYITTNASQYLDTDVYAKNGIMVEMTTVLTSTNNWKRFFSTHDPADYSGQNWADASGTWALQTGQTYLEVKPLGYAGAGIQLQKSKSDVLNKTLRYQLYCSGLLNIYNTDNTLYYTLDTSSYITDPTKVSQTNIRIFGRDPSASGEYINSKTYDIKIYDNNSIIRHYVPVKRLSDNKIGFYETETETFLTSSTSSDFTGTSKSTPEYIYGSPVSSERYVNKIKKVISGQSVNVNKIYHNGQVYWGNDIQAPSPPQFTGIRGTASVTSTTLSNAIYYNDTYHNVEVDENGNWEIEEPNPIVKTQGICRNSQITTIDFTKTIWGTMESDGMIQPLECLFKWSTGDTSGLTDVYFDFTGQDTQHIFFGPSQMWGSLYNCRCHGLGTFNWSGEINITDSTRPYKALGMRETGNRLIGTFDIRGIDTTGITDQDQTYMDWMRTTWSYGLWYQFGRGIYCDTWIVGKLEIQSGNSTQMGNPKLNCTTLYCTSTTPPSLDRTGATGTTCFNWLSQLSKLTNIYVPTGCLSAYQNASGWSARASLMSEREAPSPLSV